MAHYVTTHDSKCEAVFSDKIPAEHAPQQLPGGTMSILSATHSFPVDVSIEADVDQYADVRTNGLGMRICPENGTSAGLIEMGPNSESPMHRTMTLDVDVVIEGIIELHLGSGEKRTMRAGDSVTMRATMHKWVNVTPNNGVAKMVGFAQVIKEPLEIAGKQLETDFVF